MLDLKTDIENRGIYITQTDTFKRRQGTGVSIITSMKGYKCQPARKIAEKIGKHDEEN